jgi:hypothetical protein
VSACIEIVLYEIWLVKPVSRNGKRGHWNGSERRREGDPTVVSQYRAIDLALADTSG